MKTGNLLFIVFILGFLCTEPSFATKWRVNNTGIQADFATLQEAHNSSLVIPGDTIYLESSMNSYGDFTSSKRLIIIGPGFLLAENDSTQENRAPAILGNVTIYDGSQGSLYTGITVNGQTYMNCGNLFFKRDNLVYITVAGSSSNIAFNGCILGQTNVYDGSSNICFSNNLFTYQASFGYSLLMHPSSSGSLTNNIFFGNQVIYNSVYRNNIMTCSGYGYEIFSYSNTLVQYNICAAAQYPQGGGNQQVVNMDAVFLGTGSSDGRYRLKPGSPAIAQGYGGVDIGMFGGAEPYVLSGMPSVPSIWLMEVDGLNVTVKAKSH